MPLIQNRSDAQSSYEKAIGAVLGGLSCLNLNTWAGVLEYYMTISPVQLVIDSEVWGAVSRIRRGVDFSPVSMAIDIIKEGASKGDFLGHKHTLENLQREQWFPLLSDRRSHSNWKSGGGLDASRRAMSWLGNCSLNINHPRCKQMLRRNSMI